jgi:signal transduction histidine kinase
MKRFKLYILLFCLALCLPLSYVIWRTYAGVAQEERAQLRFFAESLFDDMERELAELVRREENRAVDHYHHPPPGAMASAADFPLATPPAQSFILGYLQNNPDGSAQLPLAADLQQVPEAYRAMVDELQEANRLFNGKRYALPDSGDTPQPVPVADTAPPAPEPMPRKDFAERYRAPSERQTSKTALGQQSVRKEEITPRQAARLTQAESYRAQEPPAPPASVIAPHTAPEAVAGRFQVEVAPLQPLLLDTQRLFVFRRVVIADQVFRQGFVLDIQAFLNHLARNHFTPHPMADFTHLRLMTLHRDTPLPVFTSGAQGIDGSPVATRIFPAPFQLFSAAVLGDKVPPSTTRGHLNVALAGLTTVMLLGLLAIYHSVRAVVDLSERRSRFVASVTHELKTPLTNIRLYAEMLDQGIAATPEREHAYLGIIGSESARLSRLINNVLELSRLENRQHCLHLQPGRLDEVLSEVQAVMAPKLEQEGFQLEVRTEAIPDFKYDREAMIQILINLVENSIKFGHDALQRQITIHVRRYEANVQVVVQDSGPGIPRRDLERVFDDFYRVDNALTRNTSGTGIGLALVRKLVQAMGGRVSAANNQGPGCTITITQPL